MSLHHAGDPTVNLLRLKLMGGEGGTYNLEPTGTTGISELHYSIKNSKDGVPIIEKKTVYDSPIYNDDLMLDMSSQAGEKAFSIYKNDSTKRIFEIRERDADHPSVLAGAVGGKEHGAHPGSEAQSTHPSPQLIVERTPLVQACHRVLKQAK